jgi:cytochrome c nitrite reductase small subunit
VRTWGLLGLAVSLGLVVGLGVFTIVYAKGYSYLSDDPRACVNCHIMRDNFDTWTVATHRNVTCNQCHVPGSFPSKYISKARNGWYHSYAFTFEDVQSIRIRTVNQVVLQGNCESCHQRLLIHMQPPGAERVKFCFDCHKGVGHGL